MGINSAHPRIHPMDLPYTLKDSLERIKDRGHIHDMRGDTLSRWISFRNEGPTVLSERTFIRGDPTEGPKYIQRKITRR